MTIGAYFEVVTDAYGEIEIDDAELRREGINPETVSEYEMLKWLLAHSEHLRLARASAKESCGDLGLGELEGVEIELPIR